MLGGKGSQGGLGLKGSQGGLLNVSGSERRGTQYQFDVTVKRVDFKIADKKWKPEAFVIEWKRKARLVSTLSRAISKTENGMAEVEWNQAISMLATMYSSNPSSGMYDMKEYKFALNEMRTEKPNKLLATGTLDMSIYADMGNEPFEIEVPLKCSSTKIREAKLQIVLQARFLRDDVEEDALSCMSGIGDDQGTINSDDDESSPRILSTTTARNRIMDEMEDDEFGNGFVITTTDSSLEEQVVELETKVKEMDGALKAKDEEIQRLQSERHTFEQEKLELAVRVETLTAELDSQQSEGDAALEVLRLRGELKRKETQWAEERTELEEEIERCRSAGPSELPPQQYSDTMAKFDVQNPQRELIDLRERYANLQRQYEEQEREFHSLKIVHENMEAQNKKLKVKNVAAMGGLATLKKKMSQGWTDSHTENGPSSPGPTSPGLAPPEPHEVSIAEECSRLVEQLIGAKMELASMTYQLDETVLEKKELQRKLAKEKARCMEYARKITELDVLSAGLQKKARNDL
eukprot:comp18064_c0_seq1/m.18641 comp18064_c0_seq1/g.18641  ORF comp18064_c0_seq1/g.18641 comp18064_c0_seq1/m.18641 type:complete len:521 (-) comp18064_c0_seq1:242-1804(-)